MIIVNKHLVPKGFLSITIWPFIFFTRKPTVKELNHERIHLKQQIECLIIPFYIIYVINYLFTGYVGIAFEREAYDNDKEVLYLNRRKHFAWVKYWFKNTKQTLIVT